MPAAKGTFQRLDAQEVDATLSQLCDRIEARFPERNLVNVAVELHDVIGQVNERIVVAETPTRPGAMGDRNWRECYRCRGCAGHRSRGARCDPLGRGDAGLRMAPGCGERYQ